jgi:hypothetical protein
VWYTTQRWLISLLPFGELSYRLPSLAFALLTVILTFILAVRWRGVRFAMAWWIVLMGSQPFVYLAQLNRFYAMPLFLLMASLALVWLPSTRPWLVLAILPFVAAVAVLSHNMIMPVFVLAFVAACAAWIVDRFSFQVVLRLGAAATTGLALYFFYIRPLVQGWHSTGNPTPVLVSFAAHAGIPTLALAGLGMALALVRRDETRSMRWWGLLFIGSLCLFQITDISWNPRYFIFFMPALWALAAHGVDHVAGRLESSWLRLCWFGCVGLLFAPGLLSHYADGSRHDYRTAASVVIANAKAGQPVLSDDAETISYYLPADIRPRLLVRTKVTEFPAGEFLLVVRGNAWMPLAVVPGREMVLLSEIGERRYDQFSHILRVYRVPATDRS